MDFLTPLYSETVIAPTTHDRSLDRQVRGPNLKIWYRSQTVNFLVDVRIANKTLMYVVGIIYTSLSVGVSGILLNCLPIASSAVCVYFQYSEPHGLRTSCLRALFSPRVCEKYSKNYSAWNGMKVPKCLSQPLRNFSKLWNNIFHRIELLGAWCWFYLKHLQKKVFFEAWKNRKEVIIIIILKKSLSAELSPCIDMKLWTAIHFL